MPYIGAGIQRFNTADELTVTGDAQIDTTTLVVDSTNNRVGVGLTAPDQLLHLRNASGNCVAVLGQFGTGTKASLTAAANQVDLKADNGTNDFITFTTGSSERLRIKSDGDVSIADGDLVIGTSGHGIDFSATSDASGNTSELLDDYEEGTFTPEIRIGGSTSGITNNSQVGQYTKIGRMVTLTGRVSISNKGSNTGAMTIAGMPFASQNTSNLESFGVVELQNMSTGTDNLGSLTNNNVYCRISPNVLTIEMRRTMHDANDITNVQMTDTTVVGFTITYFT